MRIVSVLAGLAALGVVHAAAAPDGAQTRFVEINPDRSIDVTGEASVEAAPDLASVTLGVTSTGADAGAAMAENSKTVAALIAAVKGEGVAPADIRTSSLTVTPDFAAHQQGSSEPPAITGYTVGNMVTLTVRDVSRLGALIDKATRSGANALYGVAFSQSATSALTDKARPAALADARRKAEIYASAAGVKLGRLIQLSENVGEFPAPARARVFAAAAMAAPPPIEAGQDKLTVTVSARYELTQ